MSLRNHCYKQLAELVQIFSLLSADGVKGLLLFTHPKEELQGKFFLERGNLYVHVLLNFATFFWSTALLFTMT